MLDLDIKQFWKDDALAHVDNCFSKSAPQVALGIRMSEECVFAELEEEGEPWGYTPPARRAELNRRYNEKALEIVGIKLLNENIHNPDCALPPFRQIGEVFGSEYIADEKSSIWLTESIHGEAELEKALDKIDKMSLRDFILPSNWESEKKRIFETYGVKPGQFFHVRGPVTLATSVYGTEPLLLLYYDNPELFVRFSETILKVIDEYISIFIEESGKSMDDFTHGFNFNDDNCCLMTPEMYQSFGYPVLKGIFEKYAPDEKDIRYQHSDSPMEHLLPLLSDFNLTGCNFGPTVTVDEIRKYMKNTRIDGQLAPFTFMNNDENAIISEVKRDCEMAKKDDLRGLNLSTAGSINNGSLLSSMRTVMAAIQNYGRY